MPVWTEAEFNPLFHFNDKRRIIQDLYILVIKSYTGELKDCTLLNFNAEFSITIGGCAAVGSAYLNGRTNHLIIEPVYINHPTCYLERFSTYTTSE